MMGRKAKKTKKHKTEIVFNEDDRRDFITGFKKRKQARRRKALENFATIAKNEKKAERQQKRDADAMMLKQLLPGNILLRPPPCPRQPAPSETHISHTDTHTVTVTRPLSDQSPARVQEESDTEESSEIARDSLVGSEAAAVIPGMNLTSATKRQQQSSVDGGAPSGRLEKQKSRGRRKQRCQRLHNILTRRLNIHSARKRK